MYNVQRIEDGGHGASSAFVHPTDYALSSSYRLCRVRTASSVYSASISSENLISEVVMARMLTPRAASALNARAATPAWLRMPTPITDTLATSVEPSRWS